MSLLRDSVKIQKKDNQDINDAEGQYHGGYSALKIAVVAEAYEPAAIADASSGYP